MQLSRLTRALAAATGDAPALPDYELPPWAGLVLLVDLVVVIPLVVVLNYTLKAVYPVFAMVEDEKPPAYQPLSLHAAEPEPRPEPGPHPLRAGLKSCRRPPPPRTVTSSLRAINRLLLATGGVTANLRGLACALAQALATSLLVALFAAAGPGRLVAPVAALLAALALVQLSAAWVHVVVALPSPRPFWRRLPPFKRTFDATWKPVTLHWFAVEVARCLPLVLTALLRLDLPDWHDADRRVDGPFVAKSFAVVLVAIAGSIFLAMPAKVILVRVQASLLPVDEDTIIPFDRSFDGRVEPVVVGGRGYATMSDAWATFSSAAWRRLLVLYLKIFVVSVAGMLLIVALLLPEAIAIASKSVRVE